MCPSDLLLLDEPTNHGSGCNPLAGGLARATRHAAADFHDRDFSTRWSTTSSTEQRKLTLYRGGYSAFERTRAERLAQQQQAYEKQQAQRAHMESFIRRFKAKATKARRAQSRIKALERLEELAPAHVDSLFDFRFREATRSPVRCWIGRGPPRLWRQTGSGQGQLQLVPGARIGLLVPTVPASRPDQDALRRAALGGPPARGETRWSATSPSISSSLDPKASPLLHSASPPTSAEQTLRDFLGGFDFRGDRCDEPVLLSGGGAPGAGADRPQAMLLLDEPTNHLDRRCAWR